MKNYMLVMNGYQEQGNVGEKQYLSLELKLFIKLKYMQQKRTKLKPITAITCNYSQISWNFGW